MAVINFSNATVELHVTNATTALSAPLSYLLINSRQNIYNENNELVGTIAPTGSISTTQEGNSISTTITYAVNLSEGKSGTEIWINGRPMATNCNAPVIKGITYEGGDTGIFTIRATMPGKIGI